MRVEQVTVVDDAVVEAFARLVPQLSSSAAIPGRDQIAEVLAAPGTTVLVALSGPGDWEQGREWAVVGTLTLLIFQIPTGVRAWIEDVVVDSAARGTGVGVALVSAAVERARLAGARTVELTSRPSREAANRLYLRAGFERRETNVYRLSLQ
ncbi:MAG: GNAT family N-acetyltransferase [Acidimicrobiales bacterium]